MTKSFDSLVASIKERGLLNAFWSFVENLFNFISTEISIFIKLTLDKHDSLITGFE